MAGSWPRDSAAHASRAQTARAKPIRAHGGRPFGTPWRPPAGPVRSEPSPSVASNTAWSSSMRPVTPLRPATLWNDTRPAEDAERLTRLLGAEPVGDVDGSATGRLLHGVQVGLAPPNGTRPCAVRRGGPAAARLPHRTPDRSRNDRSRRRLGDGLVVACQRPIPRRDPGAAQASSCRRSSSRRSWARTRSRAP